MEPWLSLVDCEKQSCFFDSKYNLPNFTLSIEKLSNFSKKNLGIKTLSFARDNIMANSYCVSGFFIPCWFCTPF